MFPLLLSDVSTRPEKKKSKVGNKKKIQRLREGKKSYVQTHHRQISRTEVFTHNFTHHTRAQMKKLSPLSYILSVCVCARLCVQTFVYCALQKGGRKQILVMNRSLRKCRHCDEQIELCRGLGFKKKL